MVVAMVRDLDLKGYLSESALMIRARSCLWRRSQARSPQAGAACTCHSVARCVTLLGGDKWGSAAMSRGESRIAWLMMTS